jgi:transaldolase
MSLYLDSALPQEAQRAAALGFVEGITTNPTLLAKVEPPARELIPELCQFVPGTVFYQLREETPDLRQAEGEEMLALVPGQVGLKIPCSLENLRLAAYFARRDHVVGVTAIFHPAQVLLACAAGARYVLPYVNRSTRLLGDGPRLLQEMREVIETCGAEVEIIAASIKTPEEAVQTALAGAHHLTLPLTVIEAMADHELSTRAIEAFAEADLG